MRHTQAPFPPLLCPSFSPDLLLQTAMTMYKNFQKHTPNSPYYFWAVMSIVMQAHVATSTGMAAMAERMFLPLAEKMMQKAASDKRIGGAETLRLYVMILMLQKKYAEVFQLLQDDLDNKFRDDSPLLPLGVERDRLLLECHVALAQWPEVASKYKEMIKTDTEEFLNYQGYFDATEAITKAAGAEGDSGLHLTECKAFIDENMASSSSSGGKISIRGPLLATLELAKRQPALGGAAVDCAAISKLLLEFTRELGSKTSCFHDIKPYLALMGDQSPAFLGQCTTLTTSRGLGFFSPKWCQQSRFETCFAPKHRRCCVKNTSRIRIIIKCNPHSIYDWGFRPAGSPSHRDCREGERTRVQTDSPAHSSG